MAAEEIYAEFRNGTHEKYQLDSTAYLIPTNIDKFGLSKMINDLLGLKEYVEFDIIFNDQRLRTTISEKLDEYKISSESTITITYTLAADEPLSIDVDNVSDWIASLSYAENIDISAICCYDGYISFYKNNSTEKLSNFTVDKKSATAIHLHDKTYFDSIFEVIIGQINGIIEIYAVDSDEDIQHNIIASNNRTSNTITAIVTDQNGEIIIAGDYENSISLYKNVDIPYKNTLYDKSNVGKRKYNETETIPLLKTLKIHSKPITDLAFLPSQYNILVSSSLDKLFILSDLSNESSLLSCNTGKPVTCFTVAKHSKIAVGHDDGTISLWDIRMGGTKSPGIDTIERDSNLTKLCSASVSERLVSDISWNPVYDHILSVIGLDGRMSIIDTRIPTQPLHSVRFELGESYDRGTGCCWTSNTSLLCSTASGALKKYSYNL